MNRLFAVFTASFLLLFSVLLFITCKKEYSFEAGPPPPGIAIFTLAGAPVNCENAVINGSYITGVPLSSSNMADIHVNVTAIGTYTLNTDTIDGIWFSASGTFTTTGNQTITLIGNGTPVFAKDLLFTILTPGSTCTFNLTVSYPEATAAYVLESGYGIPNPCHYTLSGTLTSNTPLSNSNTVAIRVFVVTPGSFTIATNTVNGMMFFYSGIFTITGFQDVILYGSGTPPMQGTYTLVPGIIGPHPLGGEACSFFLTVH
jgi:hypothetical protein